MDREIKKTKDKVGDINFIENPIKVLVLYFGTEKLECEKSNWETKFEKAKK